jgi:ABC-type uncharacterized transport system substrate-binding protein
VRAREIIAWLARAALAAGLLLPASTARAHPHVFVENAVEVLFDRGAPVGVRLRWTFDEAASAALRQGHASGATGSLTEADVRQLEEGAFGTLAERGYLTVVRIDGRPLKAVQPRDFSAASSDGKLSYVFTVPIEPHAVEGEAGSGKIEVVNFDPDYFLSFALSQSDPIRAAGDPPPTAECGARAAKQRAGLWGLVPVDVAVCTYAN